MVIHFDALAHCSWVACYNLIAEDKKGLTMEEREYLSNDEAIDAFHALWDCFPGMARLIDEKHNVLAANPFAEKQGFVPGAVCAKVGDPAIHRKCGLRKMFVEKSAVFDQVIPGRVRGWMPVSGRADLCIHFAVFIPQEDEQVLFEG